MKADFHVHTAYCDGKSTPEETVLQAIEYGFDSLGLSGHGFTPFDTRYCINDTEGYIKEVNSLKEKYKDRIQIYLGTEEDARTPVNRSDYDYIIGSCHYVEKNGGFYPVDSGMERFNIALGKFDGDALAFAEKYYSFAADYVLKRRPDIIGHFDLITKYEETDTDLFLSNEKYFEIAEKYLLKELESECFFEVNTGAMAKELRTAPYPHERLLHIIKKHGGRLVLSSDCHFAPKLGYKFDETKAMLCDIGFDGAYALYDGKFVKYSF